MPVLFEDNYGHRLASTAPALSAGAVSTTAAGTIAPTTNAGASPTVTAVSACDEYGTFTLNPVTGGGGQSNGEQVLVTFTNTRSSAPRLVNVTVVDSTTATTPAAVAAYATSITAASFKISTPALTTAHNYTVTFHVLQ